ncbi:high light inducible protein [Prochlorococcus marinus]|uniref:high light inducible protein n=1 Tax=Prochlorococcus marinus TaxID=1219 RepID=UPI0022B46FE4|nr:high light inducible protein [Prochlorococcus marinus]
MATSNDTDNQKTNQSIQSPPTNNNSVESSGVKWLDNENKEVKQVFGFNPNAELVNSRAAMIGFLMLILTELIFNGKPVTLAIFGIN